MQADILLGGKARMKFQYNQLAQRACNMHSAIWDAKEKGAAIHQVNLCESAIITD